MTFFVLYMMAMVLPGAVITRSIGLVKNRLCTAVALSMSIPTLLMVATRFSGLGLTTFTVLLTAVYAALIIVAVKHWRGRIWSIRLGNALQGVHLVTALTLLTAAIYVVWAGPYVEVPADAWWHMGQINDQLREIEDGKIGAIGSIGGLFEKTSGNWHAVVAFFLNATGMRLEQALTYLALANTLLFCVSVYFFSVFLFEKVEAAPMVRHLCAAASVFFFITQFGISVFSYVRYYTYAPSLLNYIVYLGAIGCLIQFVDVEQRDNRLIITTGALGAAAAVVHLQEAVFIAAMGGSILLVLTIQIFAKAGVSSPGSFLKVGRSGPKRRTLALFSTLLLAYIFLHGTAYFSVARNNPLEHGLMADIRNYMPFLQNLYVLKPTQQFYQVVTVWGVSVYLLFLLRYKRFISSPYIIAGMALPFVTVFNPIFTDFFLRFSGPDVLWRMCYTLPLPFVGGYFFVKGIRAALRASSYRRKTGGLVVGCALIGLLLPVDTVFFVSPYSKIYTVMPVRPQNDYRVWSDLLTFLESREESDIITDQVTGYVINGLTKHDYRGYKFYSKYASHINLDDYTDEDFYGKEGWKRLVRYNDFDVDQPWLVIINQRDGGFSETGRYGGHWPEDVMKVTRQYSEGFVEYVTNRPEVFMPVWTEDHIAVYAVAGT